MSLNVLDLILLVLIAGGTWLGYARGFAAMFISIAGFFLAYIAAFAFHDDAAPWIRAVLPLPAFGGWAKFTSIAIVEQYIYHAIAFILIFIGVKLGLTGAGQLLKFIARGPVLSVANRWSGALLGLVEATLLVVLAVYLLSIIPNPSIQQIVMESEIASYIVLYLPIFAEKLQFLRGRTPEAAFIIIQHPQLVV